MERILIGQVQWLPHRDAGAEVPGRIRLDGVAFVPFLSMDVVGIVAPGDFVQFRVMARYLILIE
jgi:hypothetical protein